MKLLAQLAIIGLSVYLGAVALATAQWMFLRSSGAWGGFVEPSRAFLLYTFGDSAGKVWGTCATWAGICATPLIAYSFGAKYRVAKVAACLLPMVVLTFVWYAVCSGGRPQFSFGFFKSFLVIPVALVCLMGFGVSYLIRLADTSLSQIKPKDAAPPSRRPHGPYNLGGFTLIEILVVVAIIAILAALLFPVFAKSTQGARQTSDVSKLRQVFLAINLYESDHDQATPRYLETLVPTYAPKEIMASDLDERMHSSQTSFPSAVWMIRNVDDPADVDPKVSYPISWAFLPTFSARFQKGVTLESLRAKPEVGLIADVTTGPCSGRCVSEMNPSDVACPRPGCFTVRNDGSLVKRINSKPEVLGCFNYEQMFLFFPM